MKTINEVKFTGGGSAIGYPGKTSTAKVIVIFKGDWT